MRVKEVTGPGRTTSVRMESADLGIMRWDPQRDCVAALFGDNFSYWKMTGDWQSPSIVLYDEQSNVLGVPSKDGIDTEGARKQCWDYPHNNPDFSTILPTDFIRIGGWWYMAAMVTAGLGHEKRTVFWQSKDLVDWEKTDPYISLVHLDKDMRPVGHPGNTMLTFDRVDEWIYIFGTGGLARDKPIYLWRCPSDTFPHGEWEPWGRDHVSWNWNVPNEHTPVLGGRFGELCFRVIQGNYVLSFFDAGNYRQTALCAAAPTNWGAAARVDYANGVETPQLYGGYIHPSSRLSESNGMRFWVSQWNTANNDPYHVVEFADTLAAAAPLTEPEPVPEPEPEPQPTPKPPPTGEQMSPQELYELLMRELSASGSKPITTPEGDTLTLREAVEEIHYKERGLHDLTARPRHPAEQDDQLGHVLNTRGEGLQTLALVAALAQKAGINVERVFDQVQRSIS